jgi:hypothetical protein
MGRAGLALIVAPALLIRLLFSPWTKQGRLKGWPAQLWYRWGRRAVGHAMTTAALPQRSERPVDLLPRLLLSSSQGFGSFGPLWAVVAMHGAMAIWCVWLLRSSEPGLPSSAICFSLDS